MLQVHWMMIHHLGGWKLWALSMDYFSVSFCTEGKCLLAKALSQTLGAPSSTPSTSRQQASECSDGNNEMSLKNNIDATPAHGDSVRY